MLAVGMTTVGNAGQCCGRSVLVREPFPSQLATLLARAFASALRAFPRGLGKLRSRSSRASTMAATTTIRVNHLLSAGTMYQGALFVLVLAIMSSYATMYLSQCWRSMTSVNENFQFFEGLFSRSRKRRRCSSFDR